MHSQEGVLSINMGMRPSLWRVGVGEKGHRVFRSQNSDHVVGRIELLFTMYIVVNATDELLNIQHIDSSRTK